MSSHPRTRLAPRSPANPDIDLARHQNRCAICKHQDREPIEAAFLRWHCVVDIKNQFNLPSRNCVYDHAHALNLFQQRARNIRSALELIVEKADDTRPNSRTVIEAVKMLSQLDDDGRWQRPPSRVIIQAERSNVASAPELLKSTATVTLGPGEFHGSGGLSESETSQVLFATPQEQNCP
jgi:hypothetical protein